MRKGFANSLMLREETSCFHSSALQRDFRTACTLVFSCQTCRLMQERHTKKWLVQPPHEPSITCKTQAEHGELKSATE